MAALRLKQAISQRPSDVELALQRIFHRGYEMSGIDFFADVTPVEKNAPDGAVWALSRLRETLEDIPRASGPELTGLMEAAVLELETCEFVLRRTMVEQSKNLADLQPQLSELRARVAKLASANKIVETP